MEITQKIIEYCGLKPENLELTEIGNDPSFVFENDPNFQTVALYDSDGNTIFVNSWLECANYVNGGWFDGVYDLINAEKYLFFGSITFLMIYNLIKKNLQKVVN